MLADPSISCTKSVDMPLAATSPGLLLLDFTENELFSGVWENEVDVVLSSDSVCGWENKEVSITSIGLVSESSALVPAGVAIPVSLVSTFQLLIQG